MSTHTLQPAPPVNAEAFLTIEWSANSALSALAGEWLYLAQGAAILEAEHIRQCIERRYSGGSDKTKFVITYPWKGEVGTYTGTFHVGCDYSTLLAHLRGAVEYLRDQPWLLGGSAVGARAEVVEHLARCIEAQRGGRTFYLAR